MKNVRKAFFSIVVCHFMIAGLAGQASTYVDEGGIMRWTRNSEEVSAFGVNYIVAMAHSFRSHEYLGIPHERAIDADVYHFARMGLDGYRIHVWDTEISDSAGNLVFNKHLQLWDYLLYRLKERDIKMLLTPMCLAPNGYPDPSTPTAGFNQYMRGQRGALTDTGNFHIQELYLSQFVSHVNPYTGIAYKDEPNIIAFEINNEPVAHGGRPDLTTTYINTMAEAIRGTGCEKPIFYNMSHNIDQIDNFCAAAVQGGTFQWYPTGLVANHDQKGNFLPNVDIYPIPFEGNPLFKNKARASYEFSPADVGASSHLYPAMARSFREAGFQFAAQFAYDPMYMAYANTDYQTHYLSLPYAPGKAMGMMIACEVFHRLPLGKSYGRYPENNTFDVFRLSYEDDLAEMVTNEKFLYTNHTGTVPPEPSKLIQVAGTGSSSIVTYEGTGVYFLDRLDPGVWRLEVMPDAIWVRDPFEPASLQKKVSVILWKEWPMTIQLPDLGSDFSIEGLNDGNDTEMIAAERTFRIRPGSYLLTRKNINTGWDREDTWKNIMLKEFYAPETNCDKTFVLHEPPGEIDAGSAYILKTRIVTARDPEAVELVLLRGRQRKSIPMERIAGFEYVAGIPAEFVSSPGNVDYYISIIENGICRTFPADMDGHPFDWDFYDRDPWKIRVVEPTYPVCLFDAEADGMKITRMARQTMLEFVPAMQSGKLLVKVEVDQLNDDPEHHYSIRSYFSDRVEARKNDMGSKKELAVYGQSLNGRPCKCQLTLLMKDGTAYGGVLTLEPEEGLYRFPVKDLQTVRRALIPRGYPVFLPYWFEMRKPSKPDLAKAESIQISVGPDIPEAEYGEPHGVAIGRVLLQ